MHKVIIKFADKTITHSDETDMMSEYAKICSY